MERHGTVRPVDAPARIALVTGAGSGIGRAVALGLAADGWAVVLAGRRRTALDETAALARATPSSASRLLVHPVDVTDAASVDGLFQTMVEHFGRLDFLFNNAGITMPATPFDEITADDWRRVIDVNVTGAFLCARAAFALMKGQQPRGGRIVNNGSIAAHVPRPHAAAYAASKHAVTGLTKAIALDGRAHDIACGQIDIGNTRTDMAAGFAGGVRQPDGRVVPEPLFDVRHVVDAVRYMAALPLDANVPFLTVMATTMPFLGRG